MSITLQQWTPDTFRKGEVSRQDALKKIGGAAARQRRAGESLQEAAAYALHALMHPEVTPEEGDDVVVPTRKSVQDAWGFTGGYMTQITRLGTVAYGLGILPGTPEWTLLAGRSGAQVKEVGYVIEETHPKSCPDAEYVETLTIERLREVLSVVFDGVKIGDDGALVIDGQPGRKSAQDAGDAWARHNGWMPAAATSEEEEGEQPESGTDDAGRNTRSIESQIEAALRYVVAHSDEWGDAFVTAQDDLIEQTVAALYKAQARAAGKKSKKSA